MHIASATYSSGIAAHIDGVEQQVAEALKNFLLNKIRGGADPLAVPTPGGVPQASQPAALKAVNLSQQISSDTYPITKKWFLVNSFTYIFYSAFLTFIISSWIFAPGKHSDQSLAEVFGFHPGGNDILFIGIVIFIMIYGFRLLWLSLWQSSYRFQFLPEYILLKDGVISREERHLPYHTIQNVTVSQSFFEKLFSICSVTIQNAATGAPVVSKSFSLSGGGSGLAMSGIQIPGQTLENGRKISDILNSIISQTADTRSGL